MRTATKSCQNTRIFLQWLSIALLGCSGCAIPDVVLWLPDSSGIVYSEKNGSRLAQYDLTRHASRVIVADTNTNTPWPALRADGKRVAVAKVESIQTEGSDRQIVRTQILIYDLNGRLLEQSSVNEYASKLNEPSKITGNKILQSALNWAGPPSKLVVCVGETAIYDCTTDTWTHLGELLPWPYGNTPIRPDEEGFAAIAKVGESERLCFVDWGGWIREFPKHPNLNDATLQFLGSEWQGDVLILIFTKEVFEFDTTSMKMSRKKKEIEFVHSDGDLTAFYRFQGNTTQLCQFSQKKGDNTNSPAVEWSLEIQIPNLGKRKVLFTSQEYSSFSTFFPSPDKKKVALTLVDEKDHKRVIVVIDDNGEILAKVKPN